jgi:hypothetical protein
VVVELLGDRRERRSATVSGQARAAEYELIMGVRYRVRSGAGEELVADQWLERERVFRVDRDNLVGSSEEQALLEREMQAELVQQIIRSINAVAAALPRRIPSTQTAAQAPMRIPRHLPAQVPVQVKSSDLVGALERGLAPLYFISGDDTLLVEEACDAVLRAARAQGFDERSVLHADSGFKWNDVLQDAASMSLFAARRVIDLRVPGAKFDRDASEVLRRYAQQPAADTLLLIRSPRLEARQRSSAWFKALEQAGVVVLVWPVGQRELPRWLGGRLRAAGCGWRRKPWRCWPSGWRATCWRRCRRSKSCAWPICPAPSPAQTC